MNSRRTRQVSDVTAPLLASGDEIDCVGLAKVGSVSVKRRLLTTTLAAALSGGSLIAVAQPRPLYFALTRQRLLFFAPDPLGGKPGRQPVMDLPRQLLTVEPPSSALLGLGLKTVLGVAGGDHGLKLTFPPAYKSDARDLTSRLPQST